MINEQPMQEILQTDICQQEQVNQIQDECPICLEPFDEYSNIACPSSCDRHYYHNHCMIKFILQSPFTTCPMDRKPFNTYTYQNSVSHNSSDIITTNVYWYVTDNHKVIVFSHFYNEQYIGTNIHSLEFQPTNSIIVDIMVKESIFQSFYVNNELDEIKFLDRSSNDKHGDEINNWRLNLKQDYHENLHSSSVSFVNSPSSDIRHFMISFSTMGNETLVDQLMDDINYRV